MGKRKRIIPLIFIFSFAHSSLFALEEFQPYEFSLTFPPQTKIQDILSEAASFAVNKAISDLNIKIDEKENINPNEFVPRLSIRKKEAKPDGIEYLFYSSVNVKKLLFFLSTGEKTYSLNLSNCSFATPIITRAILEYAASAEIKCYISYIQESSGISTLKLNIEGYISKDKVPYKFKKTYFFFSIPPYDKMWNDISKSVEMLGLKKVFKIVEQEVEISDPVSFLDSLQKKAYFFSVIPFEVRKTEGTYKLKIVFVTFPVIPDEHIYELVQEEAKKFGAISIPTDSDPSDSEQQENSVNH